MSQISLAGRTLSLALLVAALGLAGLGSSGCARGVTIDEAYGRPDATRWTYFNVPAQRTIDAISRYYSGRGIATESARNESDGVVLSFGVRTGGVETGQILVQATTVEGFQSRAQIYPERRPIPQDAETYVTRFQED